MRLLSTTCRCGARIERYRPALRISYLAWRHTRTKLELCADIRGLARPRKDTDTDAALATRSVRAWEG